VKQRIAQGVDATLIFVVVLRTHRQNSVVFAFQPIIIVAKKRP
jgi:hypothetical protein